MNKKKEWYKAWRLVRVPKKWHWSGWWDFDLKGVTYRARLRLSARDIPDPILETPAQHRQWECILNEVLEENK